MPRFFFALCALAVFLFSSNTWADHAGSETAPPPRAVRGPLDVILTPGQVMGCWFGVDDRLFVNNYDNSQMSVEEFDLKTKKSLRKIPTDGGYVLIAPDGKTMIQYSNDKPGKVTDLKTNTEVKTVDKPFAALQPPPSLSNDGSVIIGKAYRLKDPNNRDAGSESGIGIYKRDGSLEKIIPMGVMRYDEYASVSPDGKKFAMTRANPPSIWVYDVASGKGTELSAAKDNLKAVPTALTWSPDGKYLALSTNRLLVLDAATGKTAYEYSPSFQGKEYKPGRVLFSPKGDQLVFNAQHGTPGMSDPGLHSIAWPAKADTKPKTYKGISAPSSCLGFSPSGDALVALGTDSKGQPSYKHVRVVDANPDLDHGPAVSPAEDPALMQKKWQEANKALGDELKKDGKLTPQTGCLVNASGDTISHDDRPGQGVRILNKGKGEALDLIFSMDNGFSNYTFTAEKPRLIDGKKVWEGEATTGNGWSAPTKAHLRVTSSGSPAKLEFLVTMPPQKYQGDSSTRFLRWDEQGNFAEGDLHVKDGHPPRFRLRRTCGNGFGDGPSSRLRDIDDLPAGPVPPAEPKREGVDTMADGTPPSPEEYEKLYDAYSDKVAAYRALRKKHPTKESFRATDLYRQRVEFFGTVAPGLQAPAPKTAMTTKAQTPTATVASANPVEDMKARIRQSWPGDVDSGGYPIVRTGMNYPASWTIPRSSYVNIDGRYWWNDENGKYRQITVNKDGSVTLH